MCVYIYIYIYIYMYPRRTRAVSGADARTRYTYHVYDGDATCTYNYACISLALYIYIYIYIHTNTYTYIMISSSWKRPGVSFLKFPPIRHGWCCGNTETMKQRKRKTYTNVSCDDRNRKHPHTKYGNHTNNVLCHKTC